MRCINHPETEAVTICVSCEKPICRRCLSKREGRNYCQPCGSAVLQNRPSAKLVVGGTLGATGGVIGFLAGMFLVSQAAWYLFYGGGESIGIALGLGITLLTLGSLAIAGSYFAIKGRFFDAAFAGATGATLLCPPLGIPAMVLVTISRKEFKSVKPDTLILGSTLGIIAGITGFLFGIVLAFLASPVGGGCYEDTPGYGQSIIVGVLMFVLGLIAIIGSGSARDREYFYVAFAGGICAALVMPILGIPALITIAASKKEFYS